MLSAEINELILINGLKEGTMNKTSHDKTEHQQVCQDVQWLLSKRKERYKKAFKG